MLVVDDEDSLRRALRRLLTGFEVILAADAAQAQAALGSRVFDVVLTDFSMPGYSGLQLLLDVAGTCPGTRRVLMSGLPARTFDDHVLSRLVHGVLPKPFDKASLFRAIGRTPPAPAERREATR